jgi:hypothetical protein
VVNQSGMIIWRTWNWMRYLNLLRLMLFVIVLLLDHSCLTKNKDNTLLFPTGKFVGVYYSEVLFNYKSLCV